MIMAQLRLSAHPSLLAHTHQPDSLPLALRGSPHGPSRSSRLSPPPANSAAGSPAVPCPAPAPDPAGLGIPGAPGSSAAPPAESPPALRARAPHICPVTRRPNPAVLAASSRPRAPPPPAAGAAADPGSGPSESYKPSAPRSPVGFARPPGRCCRCSRSSLCRPFSRLPAWPSRRAALRHGRTCSHSRTSRQLRLA